MLTALKAGADFFSQSPIVVSDCFEWYSRVIETRSDPHETVLFPFVVLIVHS
jgi:hypothetical protein